MQGTIIKAAHLNVNCLDAMLKKPRASYEWVRFDSNDDCNLHCVYCHNSRSKQLLDLAVFRRFLEHNVAQIENFQFGCRMEPTLDMRMVEFMEALHASPARPVRSVALQTNGILLHRHDGQRMVDAGLSDVQVSIDTIDEAVFAELRGGAKIGKIMRNLRNFAEKFPEVGIKFVVTVAKANLPYIEELVQFGIDIGLKSIIVREMFHIPGASHVDDEKMEKLVLSDGEFPALVARLEDRFSGKVRLNCIDSSGLHVYNAHVQTHSYNRSGALA